MMQRHLHFGMDHKVKLLVCPPKKSNPSSTELNEKHTCTFMELMLKMQV